MRFLSAKSSRSSSRALSKSEQKQLEETEASKSDQNLAKSDPNRAKLNKIEPEANKSKPKTRTASQIESERGKPSTTDENLSKHTETTKIEPRAAQINPSEQNQAKAAQI